MLVEVPLVGGGRDAPVQNLGLKIRGTLAFPTSPWGNPINQVFTETGVEHVPTSRAAMITRETRLSKRQYINSRVDAR